jgi:hypothetical protein
MTALRARAKAAGGWRQRIDSRGRELGRKSCNTSRPDELLLFGNVCMLEIERRMAVLREELF